LVSGAALLVLDTRAKCRSRSGGYAELTTPQIAAAAGVSVEEFCRLFGSPEQ
jgi:AcrR family transcriptional regulator